MLAIRTIHGYKYITQASSPRHNLCCYRSRVDRVHLGRHRRVVNVVMANGIDTTEDQIWYTLPPTKPFNNARLTATVRQSCNASQGREPPFCRHREMLLQVTSLGEVPVCLLLVTLVSVTVDPLSLHVYLGSSFGVRMK